MFSFRADSPRFFGTAGFVRILKDSERFVCVVRILKDSLGFSRIGFCRGLWLRFFFFFF